jgi:hypothetical protein
MLCETSGTTLPSGKQAPLAPQMIMQSALSSPLWRCHSTYLWFVSRLRFFLLAAIFLLTLLPW